MGHSVTGGSKSHCQWRRALAVVADPIASQLIRSLTPLETMSGVEVCSECVCVRLGVACGQGHATCPATFFSARVPSRICSMLLCLLRIMVLRIPSPGAYRTDVGSSTSGIAKRSQTHLAQMSDECEESATSRYIRRVYRAHARTQTATRPGAALRRALR